MVPLIVAGPDGEFMFHDRLLAWVRRFYGNTTENGEVRRA